LRVYGSPNNHEDTMFSIMENQDLDEFRVV
jgi:hypothetical protein